MNDQNSESLLKKCHLINSHEKSRCLYKDDSLMMNDQDSESLFIERCLTKNHEKRTTRIAGVMSRTAP